MRTEARVMITVAIFFGVIAICYWFTSYEDAGTVMLTASCLLGTLPGLYYLWWSHRMTPRPEDRDDATIEDGAGVVGAFPGSSIWPLVLGLGFATMTLAFVFGVWLAAPAMAIIVSGAIGGTMESRRGGKV